MLLTDHVYMYFEKVCFHPISERCSFARTPKHQELTPELIEQYSEPLKNGNVYFLLYNYSPIQPKSIYIFLISLQKNMLWVLIRSISARHY